MSFSEVDMIASFPFRAAEPVLVDVGAHHGSSSRWFARKGWRVIAFEPEPNNRAAFERNMRRYTNVTCFPVAVSDVAADDVPFFVSREHFGIHALRPFHDTHEASGTVRTVRLDDVLEEQGITSVAFLKIDIEGADFPALKGLSIEKYRPEVVMLEFMDERSKPGFGYGHADVVSYMADRRYSAFISEWAPVVGYAREGEASDPHTWLGCSAYPLDHQPAWGNLIFVPKERVAELEAALDRYLRASANRRWSRVRSIVRQIPGAKRFYNFLLERADRFR